MLKDGCTFENFSSSSAFFFPLGGSGGGTSISWMKRLGQSGLQAFRAVEGVGKW